jgi:Glycosyltransferase family 87
VYGKTTERLGPPPSYLIVILFAAVVCGYPLDQWARNHEFSFQSLKLSAEPIYAQALNDWLAGSDPYRTIHGALRFVYPPVFLYIGGFLARIIPDHVGWYLYALLHVASAVALPLVLARFYFCQPWLNAGFALLIFFAEPRFTGVLALNNGNIATMLYLGAFLAALPGLLSSRWTLFYVTVFIGALVKIPLLLLLLIPLLISTRQWRNSIFCAAAVLGAYLLQRILFPDLYAGYRWSVDQQLNVIHHYGYGILGIASGLEYKFYGKVGLASPLLATTFTLVLIVALFLLHRRISEPAANRMWISLVLLSIILASPRVLAYDADIALMAAYVIFVNVFQTRRLVALLVLLFVPSLIVPHFIKAHTLVGCYETFLVLLAFICGFVMLWRKSAVLTVAEPQPV